VTSLRLCDKCGHTWTFGKSGGKYAQYSEDTIAQTRAKVDEQPNTSTSSQETIDKLKASLSGNVEYTINDALNWIDL